jgi:murein DD-endopeptidase MepM/ murein hydrolase activator NlpD
MAAALLTAALATQEAAAKKRKLTVRITPATVTAPGTVKVAIRGTTRTKCAITVRADRKGAKVSVRRRVKRTSSLAVLATSAPGRRIVSARCGKAKASKRFTVVAATPQMGPAAPTAAADPTNVGNAKLGKLPLDVAEINGYRVEGNVGGRGFSTRVPLATGTRVRVSQGANGGWSHQDANSKFAVDLDVGADTPVRAGFSGVVAAAVGGCVASAPSACNDGWGNFVLLKHVDGTCAVHAHMKAINVAAGQQAPRYTQLGTVGASGFTNGPHLHYDHIDCGTQLSLPWMFDEAGIPAQGEFVVSGNEPPAPEPTVTPVPTAVPTAVPTTQPTPVPTQPPPPPPAPSVSISKGGNAAGQPGCSSSACRWLVINWANFGGGGHTVRAYENGAQWWSGAPISGGGGSWAGLYYGWPGRGVHVTVDGVASNTIVW